MSPTFNWVCLFLLMCSPVSNGFVYGIKSKTIQMTFVHFARKQLYKSEVHREIQQRSPISGSRRPSLSSLISSTLGNNPVFASQLQRRLSDVSMMRKTRTPSPSGRAGKQRRATSAKCMRRHASDLAWRPLIKEGNIADLVMGLDDSKRSESDHFHPLTSLSRENTLKSSKNSLDVHGRAIPSFDEFLNYKGQEDVEDSESGSVTNEDSGFTSIKGNLARQNTSNSLQIPGDGMKPLAEHEDSETQSELDTFPDSSDGENINSRNQSRNHSLTSSGIGSNRTSLTPTKANIGTTLKQLLAVSRSNSKEKPKIMITRVPTIDQSDMEFVYDDPPIYPKDFRTLIFSDKIDKLNEEEVSQNSGNEVKLDSEKITESSVAELKQKTGITFKLFQSLESSDDEAKLLRNFSEESTSIDFDEYTPLSSIEECVTPIPSIYEECPTPLAMTEDLSDRSINSKGSNQSSIEDVTIFLGIPNTTS